MPSSDAVIVTAALLTLAIQEGKQPTLEETFRNFQNLVQNLCLQLPNETAFPALAKWQGQGPITGLTSLITPDLLNQLITRFLGAK